MTRARAVSSVGTEASARPSLATAALLRRKQPREPWWGQREERSGGCAPCPEWPRGVDVARRVRLPSPRPRQARAAVATDRTEKVEHSCSSERKAGRPTVSGTTGETVGRRTVAGSTWGRYLVDSASSHMLVSKIKPCMSKYKQVYCETANGSLNQLSFI